MGKGDCFVILTKILIMPKIEDIGLFWVQNLGAGTDKWVKVSIKENPY